MGDIDCDRGLVKIVGGCKDLDLARIKPTHAISSTL